jgi:hypothetical protein
MARHSDGRQRLRGAQAGAMSVHRPKPTSWQATLITLAILGAVSWAGHDGTLDGQALVGIYSAIVGYVLGAANGHKKSEGGSL